MIFAFMQLINKLHLGSLYNLPSVDLYKKSLWINFIWNFFYLFKCWWTSEAIWFHLVWKFGHYCFF